MIPCMRLSRIGLIDASEWKEGRAEGFGLALMGLMVLKLVQKAEGIC